jgi:hypothetical protein
MNFIQPTTRVHEMMAQDREGAIDWRFGMGEKDLDVFPKTVEIDFWGSNLSSFRYRDRVFANTRKSGGGHCA